MPIFNFNQNGQVMIPLPMPIENGGTGAEDAATARANLGINDNINNAINAHVAVTDPHSQYLGKLQKAVDSELIDGIDSSRLVAGSDWSKTNGDHNINSTISQNSGFFDCHSGGDFPNGLNLMQGFQVRHSNPTNIWGMQAGCQHNISNEFFFRTISGNAGWQPWRRIWNDSQGIPVWQTPSDRRLKNSIKPIESALDLLLKTNPVRFRYTAEIRKQGLFGSLDHRCKPYYGFIAQDFPIQDLVSEKDNGFLGIDYIEIIPFLVKAIQELQEQIDILKYQCS